MVTTMKTEGDEGMGLRNLCHSDANLLDVPGIFYPPSRRLPMDSSLKLGGGKIPPYSLSGLALTLN